MTTTDELLPVLQADLDLAEAVVSVSNIVSHDGYYELDTEAVAQFLARHRIASTRPADSALGDELDACPIASMGTNKVVPYELYERVAASLRQPAPPADDALLAMVALDEELDAASPGFMCEPMPAVTDGGWCEWIHPLPGYLMQCCDCKLIHEVQFQIGGRSGNGPLNPGEGDDGVVVFRMRRRAALAASEPRKIEGDPGCP